MSRAAAMAVAAIMERMDAIELKAVGCVRLRLCDQENQLEFAASSESAHYSRRNR